MKHSWGANAVFQAFKKLEGGQPTYIPKHEGFLDHHVLFRPCLVAV